MAIFIGVPLLGILVILQSTLISRLTLLHGAADLVMLVVIAWALQKRVTTAWHWSIIAGLMVGFASALPFGVTLIGYGLSTGLALLLRQRVWQVPVSAMFVITFLGTFICQGISYLALPLVGYSLPPGEVFSLVMVPSMVLNLLFAIPVFAFIGDLARMLHPAELLV